jgi:glycosyltransferase involved in cell wall biosynthesis
VTGVLRGITRNMTGQFVNSRGFSGVAARRPVGRPTPQGGSADMSAPRRVLIFRSCRPAQFAAAVAAIRAHHANVEITALTHPGHREAVAAAGVDRIVETAGRRFGLFRTRLATLRALRRYRFSQIVIPQMTMHFDGYGNLYRLAAAIGSPMATLTPADSAPVTFDRPSFRRLVARQSRRDLTAWVQHPVVMLALLAASCLAPRRTATRGSRTRVLHIISSLGVGGAQRQLAELVNRTPVDRYDVDVLVLGHDGEFSRQWFARDGVQVTYLREWPRLVASILEVRRICRSGRYDIVHNWLFMANVVGAAGARLAGVPRVIVSVRNLSLWKRTWYRQWWFRPADMLSSRAADTVTVNADALKADHGRWACYPAARIDVVPNGLDPSQFLVDRRDARSKVRAAAGVDDDAVVIGTVGRLAPEKDHVTFLRVIAAVREQCPDAHGVIVGDGELRGQLEAAAAGMGLSDAVSFLGERPDARRLLAGFDLFMLPSAIEGFPNVLLEAAFLGVTAVASRVGGSPDILADAPHTFEAGDVAAATACVLSLLANRPAAQAAARLTRRRAFDCFTAERSAARWFALYHPQGDLP